MNGLTYGFTMVHFDGNTLDNYREALVLIWEESPVYKVFAPVVGYDQVKIP